MNITMLPSEIQTRIFQFCDTKTVHRVLQISKKVNRFIRHYHELFVEFHKCAHFKICHHFDHISTKHDDYGDSDSDSDSSNKDYYHWNDTPVSLCYTCHSRDSCLWPNIIFDAEISEYFQELCYVAERRTEEIAE